MSSRHVALLFFIEPVAEDNSIVIIGLSRKFLCASVNLVWNEVDSRKLVVSVDKGLLEVYKDIYKKVNSAIISLEVLGIILSFVFKEAIILEDCVLSSFHFNLCIDWGI